MTKQAKELIDSFYYALPNNGSPEGINSTTRRMEEAVRCALICCNKIIKALEEHQWQNRHFIEDYKLVKLEIEKL
tara:strand:- start:95 stop:319 length:225 start_codon:yes stop_codon:yes gene_type:complete